MVKGGFASTSSTGKNRNTVADIILVENTNNVRKVNTKPMPNTIKVRPSSIRSDVGTVAAPVIFLPLVAAYLCSLGEATYHFNHTIYPVVTKVARIPSIKTNDFGITSKNVKQIQQHDFFCSI
jgi:hypothetical protein